MLKPNIYRRPAANTRSFRIERAPSALRPLARFREAVPEFISILTSQTRVSLDRFDSTCFSRWIERWCSLGVAQLSTEDIRAYFTELQELRVSSQNIEREKRLLRSFFRLAQRRGACEQDPMEKLDSPLPAPAPSCVFWSPDEERRVLDACQGNYPPGTPDADSLRRPPVPPPYMHALVLLGLRTGLKLSHLLGLEWRQVDLQKACLHISAQDTWNGKDLEVVLDSESKTALLDLLRLAQQVAVLPCRVFEAVGMPVWKDRPDDFSVLHALTRILKTALVEGTDFEVVRLTYARRCAESNLPLLHPVRQGDWEDATSVREVYRLSAGAA